MARQTTKRTVAKARRLRREMSLPEVLLWNQLRHSELKFRKQHPAGPYVIDFYCAAAKVGVEIDGIIHEMGDRPITDGTRAAFLTSRGFEIMRISASDVLRSLEDVASSIEALCLSRIA